MSYKRILLIRTDRVGDLVLSTPAIASFRRSWPGARIDAVVTTYTEPALRYNPDVDAVHVVAARFSGATRRRMRELGRDADLAVALAPRAFDHLLAAWSAAKRRIGYVYRRRYLGRAAAHALLTDHCISEADPELADRFANIPVAHEVHQVLALVSLAGGTTATDALVLRVGAEDRAFAERQVQQGAVAINLSPRWFNSGFGFDATLALVERLAAGQRCCLVTYGSDCVDSAARLRDAVRAPGMLWLGELTLLQWAAALARCSVVVTVDTGATHVAAAMGVPVVVLFEHEYYRLSSQEWSPWRVPSALFCKPPKGADPAPLISDIAAAAKALAHKLPSPVAG